MRDADALVSTVDAYFANAVASHPPVAKAEAEAEPEVDTEVKVDAMAEVTTSTTPIDNDPTETSDNYLDDGAPSD